MRLHEAAAAIGARAVGANVEFDTVSTDSRHLPVGTLFVALRGPRFDGHDFAAQALAQGAAAVMIEADEKTSQPAPALQVEDTRLGLGRLAAWQRSRMPARLLAITGSNGKTTVKEMCAAILRAHAGAGAVLATEGNLNNDIGLPLMLLRLRPEHRYAVLEMGMNHPGEIAYLSGLARPDVALVNNAQRAHLAGLGSVAAVARAKGEIYGGLSESGVALYNADDANAPLWRELAGGHSAQGFGLTAGEVRGAWTPSGYGGQLDLTTPAGNVAIELQGPVTHGLPVRADGCDVLGL